MNVIKKKKANGAIYKDVKQIVQSYNLAEKEDLDPSTSFPLIKVLDSDEENMLLLEKMNIIVNINIGNNLNLIKIVYIVDFCVCTFYLAEVFLKLSDSLLINSPLNWFISSSIFFISVSNLEQSKRYKRKKYILFLPFLNIIKFWVH